VRKTLVIMVAALLFMCGACQPKLSNDLTSEVEPDEVVSDYSDLSSDDGSQPITKQLERAPSLEISLVEEGAQEQQLQAAQLTTSWYFDNGDGSGTGYEADSPHPLQLADYDEYTLQLNGENGEILLSFSDNYPPQSVSVQRWDAVYAVGGQDIRAALDKGEHVEADGNKILIIDDGDDYIYEVHAKWEQGSSYYAFRTKTGQTAAAPYEVGKVAVISDGIQYEPYVHFLYAGQKTENGFLAVDGVPFSFEEASKGLQNIQYTDDFQVVIIGSDVKSFTYSMYDYKFEIIYGGERSLIPPEEPGEYTLCLDVTWGGADTNEYMGLRYVFKIVA